MARTNTSGFTIIELLFSTVIFSVVLLLCLSALIQIGRLYYKGLTTSQTQNAARAAMDEVAQAIQFSPKAIRVQSGSAPPGPDVPVGIPLSGATDFICIGDLKYTFAIDRQQKASYTAGQKQTPHALWASHDPNCLSAAAIPETLTAVAAGGRDLLGENMRLLKFGLSPVGSGDSTWQVDLVVAYGDDDLLKQEGSTKICSGPKIGTQFCAVSDLSTIVKRRVK